ncbi:MAG: efflux RND transporter periplasmic adaptor subunit [Bacteroidota bacterium]|nr:efflux RND transporter periplasmic adaptor subunit [Bacteroidota bacterium]MDP4193083.1 efflux RND transporter periplasmic adaptor subunit [Bacteroidota bacterium]MDP4193645.1 efflux RND transporter periplasmic adaptor subunit [Bacteroidota bacterium]
MKKKIRITLGFLLTIGVIISILVFNKSSREAQIERSSYENITVSVTPVSEEEFSENLSIVGTVNANNDVAVVSETQGKVLKVFVKTGDHVSEGSIIATVDDELKQASYMTAKVNLEKAKKDLKRMEALYKEKNVSDSDLEGSRLAASAAEAQFIAANRLLNDTKIKAPISGTIADRFVDKGTMLAPGTPVANIIDISKLKVKISVPEKEVFKLKTGQTVTLKSDVYPALSFSGKVETISSKADNGHNYPVEISLPNNSRTPLKAGMFVQVEFPLIGKRQTLTIPRASILNGIKNPQVFVVENGYAKLRDIVVGKEANYRIEVISGLKVGDKVVSNGQSNLSDNLKVKIN